jgi:ubiquinone/menaquinone biosynthesis C-methylase UbiE
MGRLRKGIDLEYSDYREHYRKDAETYDYFPPPGSPEGQINRRRAELLFRCLDRRFRHPKAKILDIGAGGGSLLREFSSKGAGSIGLDIALLNLQKIADNFKKEKIAGFSLATGDAYALPFQDASIDAVIFSEVLEHLEKPEKALAEASRVLKPGGQLILSVPYKEKILYHLCIHCNKLTPSNAHLHSFDEAKLESILKGLPVHLEEKLYFQNKVLQMLNIPYRFRLLPYSIWRFMDRLIHIVIPKPYYMVFTAWKNKD